jgi:hypothetical protein
MDNLEVLADAIVNAAQELSETYDDLNVPMAATGLTAIYDEYAHWRGSKDPRTREVSSRRSGGASCGTS